MTEGPAGRLVGTSVKRREDGRLVTGRARYLAHAIELLTLDGAGRISGVMAFHEPSAAFARFGLPRELPS